MTTSDTVKISIHLEELLDIIRQLDDPARVRVAQVLMESDLDSQFKALIQRLAEGEPADDITDEMINEEIRAVRREAQSK